jgi:hypothetical protein
MLPRATALALLLAVQAATPPAVRQVDHIMVMTADPQPLFFLLTDTFKLPIAWPIVGFGDFRSGGVWIGNTNLEIVQDARQPTARFGGVAFEPTPLAAALSALALRNLATGPRNDAGPFGSGDAAVAWTTVPLPSLSARDLQVFLCEYHQPDTGAARARLAGQLRMADGGPLGLERAESIVLGSGGNARYEAEWQKLAPAESSGGTIRLQLDAGPRLVVDSNLPQGMHQLVLTVASLDRAAAFLERAGLMGSRTPDGVQIAPGRSGGLPIRIVERRP